MDLTSYYDFEPFETKDGSQIREWAGAVSAPAVNESLAEATIAIGGATTKDYHAVTGELSDRLRSRSLADRRRGACADRG